MAWLAYVDESMRQLPDRAGIYVLAAAVLESTRLHAQREAVKQIRGGRAFHWRLGDPADKRKAGSAGDLQFFAPLGSFIDEITIELE